MTSDMGTEYRVLDVDTRLVLATFTGVEVLCIPGDAIPSITITSLIRKDDVGFGCAGEGQQPLRIVPINVASSPGSVNLYDFCRAAVNLLKSNIHMIR
ncbi:hypothetical protein GJ496_001866 [Pomphorhynchus laevis]|nr:hypothetical protein GJ496_001866 [Pomphorhynchus laevis]